MSLSIDDVADFFILQSDEESGDIMSHLKLQKLCYYAQAWHLAIHKRPMFAEQFEAWVHGPVSPVLWSRFRNRGFGPILIADVRSRRVPIPSEALKVLKEVWSVYGQFTARKLEEMTHSEQPWLEARDGLPPGEPCAKQISRSTMRRCYSALLVHNG